MARVMASLAVVLFASIVSTSAVRPEPAVNAGSWATAASATSVKDLADGMQHMIASPDHEGVPFTLLTKYIIRPSMAKEFIGGWLKFRKVVQEAHGSKTIQLSKPLTDNILFYSYEEWHCKKDFFEFVKKSSAVKELAEYIEDHNIPLQITQLVPAVPVKTPSQASVSDVASQVAGMSMHALSELIADAQDRKVIKKVISTEESLETNTRNNTTILLTKFLVKPSQIVDFVEAADLVTKAVAAHDKGNLVYALLKPIDDDVTFWSYAIWEDEAAFKHHVQSSYAKKFLEYILDHDIYIKTTPVVAIEQTDA